MNTFFITSTGTEIGKTLVTAVLCHQLRAQGHGVRALKPIISGFADDDPGTDSAVLLAALGRPVTMDTIAKISPWRFTAPLSPDMAAAREGRSIDFDAVAALSRTAFADDDANDDGDDAGSDLVLIEGVGGVMAPLTADKTVLDWIAAVGAPALLVVGSYLGTLSHTLTAALALQSRGVPLSAVIVNTSDTSPVPAAETATVLGRLLDDVPIAMLPRLAGSGTSQWAAAPDLTYLLRPDG